MFSWQEAVSSGKTHQCPRCQVEIKDPDKEWMKAPEPCTSTTGKHIGLFCSHDWKD